MKTKSLRNRGGTVKIVLILEIEQAQATSAEQGSRTHLQEHRRQVHKALVVVVSNLAQLINLSSHLDKVLFVSSDEEVVAAPGENFGGGVTAGEEEGERGVAATDESQPACGIRRGESEAEVYRERRRKYGKGRRKGGGRAQDEEGKRGRRARLEEETYRMSSFESFSPFSSSSARYRERSWNEIQVSRSRRQ
jgi:hypothetical protein